MSLSFREQAAIAIAAAAVSTNLDSGTDNFMPDEMAAANAQDLADACCVQFGHDEQHGECVRCGEKLK